MWQENSLTPSTVLSRIQHLLESGLLSDVTFLAGGNEENSPERIAAHKCILGSVSPVFERMFTGNFKESRKEGNNDLEIEVPDVTPTGFRKFLRWVYMDEVTLSLENVGHLLYCAEKYDLSTLKDKCTSFMENIPSKDHCSLFYQCKLQGVIHLVPWIKTRILRNPSSSLTFDSVLDIKDSTVLNDLLSSDSFNMDEIDVFRTALHWASSMRKEKKEDKREILGQALYSVRIPLLSPHKFVIEVVPSELLNDEETMDLLKFISKTKSSVSTGFSIQRRVRCCDRFENYDHTSLVILSHSIRFRVDQPVQIHGLGIFSPSKQGPRVIGSMRLERVDSNLKEEEKSLSSKTFDVEYSIGYSRIWNLFDEPVSIKPKTLHRFCLEYDNSLLNQSIGIGRDGRKRVMVDGVEFKFENNPDGNDNATNVQKGQIPWIIFTRLPPI